MDLFTHLFLPLTVAFAVRPDLFPTPRHFLLGVFAIVPDFDKFLGLQGLLHALPALSVLSLGVLAVEYRLRGRFTYASLAIVFLASHLLLDIIDGGPAPLLFPFFKTGLGVVYPATVTFGQGPLGFVVDGPLIALRAGSPRTGHQTFGFINGFGIASLLAFAVVWYGNRSASPSADG